MSLNCKDLLHFVLKKRYQLTLFKDLFLLRWAVWLLNMRKIFLFSWLKCRFNCSDEWLIINSRNLFLMVRLLDPNLRLNSFYSDQIKYATKILNQVTVLEKEDDSILLAALADSFTIYNYVLNCSQEISDWIESWGEGSWDFKTTDSIQYRDYMHLCYLIKILFAFDQIPICGFKCESHITIKWFAIWFSHCHFIVV